MRLSNLLPLAFLAIASSVSARGNITIDVQSCVDPKTIIPFATSVGTSTPVPLILTQTGQIGVYTYKIPEVNSNELKLQIYVARQPPKSHGKPDDVEVPYTILTLKKKPTSTDPSTLKRFVPPSYQSKGGDPFLGDITFYNSSSENPFKAFSRTIRIRATDKDDSVALLYCRLLADALLQS